MKKITTFLLSIIILTSCEQDTITAVLQEGIAPQSLVTEIEVAMDNSGLVTVTPQSAGAFSYRVVFSGTPKDTLLGINGVATNVYTNEGDFSVEITATAPNEKTTIETFDFTVLLTDIINFQTGVEVSETAREVRVTPIADNATTFSLDFGDGTTQEIEAGSDFRYTYPDGGDFELSVIAGNLDTGRTNEIIQNVSFPTDPLPLLLSFDDPLTEYQFNGFNGVSTEIITNPFLSGSNEEESNVAAITNSGANFEGFTYDLPSAIDFSGINKLISVEVYFDGMTSIPVALQFVNGLNGERGVEVNASHTGSGWETLTFDFTNATNVFLPDDPDNFLPVTATGQYTQLVMFFDGPGVTAGSILLDNFMQLESDVTPPTGPEFEVNFEDEILNGSFDFGAPIQIVDNPFPTGINTSSKVLEIVRGDGMFQGAGFSIPNLDLTTPDKIVTIKIYSDVAVPVSVDLKEGLDGARSANVQALHNGTGWEELTFDYSMATKAFEDGDLENFMPLPAEEVGVYTQIVFIIDGELNAGAGNIFFMDDIIKGAVDTPPAAPEFEVNFEDEVLNGSFDFGAPIQIIDNPFAMGINTSSKVLEIVRGDGMFQGAGFSIPSIDLTTTNKIVTIKIYSDVAVPVSVDLKEGIDGARSANVQALHNGTGWEELTFDYSMATKAFEDGDLENFMPLPAEEVGVYTQVVFIIDGELTAGAGNIFFMDDIIKF